MSRLKIITSANMCKLLENEAFAIVRQKGSHRFYRHSDGRTTVIPMHTTDLDRALIRKILRDIDMSVDEYSCKAKGI
ncbi:MAG: type II toxin-antitoxin system HicA family toxin [Defluviitaleaceae bacterium]|nr:type II toxin-antitoxin system HicA family toxin [Defluviitaleaceae bacterium]